PDKNRALQESATLVLKLGKRGPETLHVVAVVTNVGAGHAMPTGNDQHLLLIRMRATDQEGHVLWENDPFRDWTTSIFGLILDNDLGAFPVETWAAAKVVSDRRIFFFFKQKTAYEI